MLPIKISILGFDGVAALDLIGPIETFAAAWKTGLGRSQFPCYETRIVGLTRRSFASESGVVFNPHETLDSCSPADTVIVPGGRGLRSPEVCAKVGAWLKARESQTRRVVSVCTGIYALASAGLLDGRRAATHWRFASDVARRFPRVKVDSNALFVQDGHFYTSAGVTAGIDLSLALIEEDYGADMAHQAARELVVYVKRPGGQEQFSEPLRIQHESSDRFGSLVSWIIANLADDLSVGALANQACLSTRHLTRRFKEDFGKSPAELVEELRLDQARLLLAKPKSSIEAVAGSVGFASVDAFRRAFMRRFGILPSSYQAPFRHSTLH